MPYFRDNRFNLFKRERRKSTIYFHTAASSRWFGSLASRWKGSILQVAALKIASLLKKAQKHPETYG
ncbi:hypothetical protein Q0590_26590 [Rhodocytophaga aerolata]|uniref:Uncharacterized protein n=1 Tax=Rhodocytophaga aerolata TaxID=455078 RepID=A0ABT8RDV4_9BACT|nr:hypothetical protein [Rhodocytophaga aerolata]MDO1449876.1 hypothetical protein [Rhodocytophaga aerolata]